MELFLECICEPMIASRAGGRGRGYHVRLASKQATFLVPILSKMKRGKKNKQGYEKGEGRSYIQEQERGCPFLGKEKKQVGEREDRRRNESKEEGTK